MGERPTFDFESRLSTKPVEQNAGEEALAQQQINLGESRVDSGESRVDSGESRVDSGESRVDLGQQEFLLRQQQADSGEIKVDSGEIKVDSGNALQSRAAQKEATGETLISNEGQVANAENLGPMQVAMPQSQNLNDPTKRVLTAEGILAHIKSTNPRELAAPIRPHY